MQCSIVRIIVIPENPDSLSGLEKSGGVSLVSGPASRPEDGLGSQSSPLACPNMTVCGSSPFRYSSVDLSCHAVRYRLSRSSKRIPTMRYLSEGFEDNIWIV